MEGGREGGREGGMDGWKKERCIVFTVCTVHVHVVYTIVFRVTAERASTVGGNEQFPFPIPFPFFLRSIHVRLLSVPCCAVSFVWQFE